MKERPAGVATRAVIVAALARLTNDGRPPSYTELAAHTGLSVSLIQWHMRVLRRQGKVVYKPGARGTIAPAPITTAHETALAVLDAGGGRPVSLHRIGAAFGGGTQGEDVARIVLADLIRLGMVMRTGRGYVRIEEPTA